MAEDRVGVKGAYSYLKDKVVLEVTNTRVWIHNADPHLLHVLDIETKYPTAVAEALEVPGLALDEYVGGWDGNVHLLRQPKTMAAWVPAGLLDVVERLCKKFRVDYQVEDHRVRPEVGMPELVKIPLRDYQEAAVDAAVKIGRGVLVMPPRSGKTRTMTEIVRRIALPTIWIAPTDRIVVQTCNVLESFFGKHFAIHHTGAVPEPKPGDKPERVEILRREKQLLFMHPVVVCTTATAASLTAEFYKTRQVLIFDEYHHAAARSYRDIANLCEHVFFRFGMTGTHFRSGEDELAMHAIVSNVIYQVSSTALVDKGHLVPADVFFLAMHAPKLRIKGGSSGSFNSGHGKYGIHEHEARNQMIAYTAKILHDTNRRVLILVGIKAQGRDLKARIKHLLPDKDPRAEFDLVEFVCSDTPRDKVDRCLRGFTESDAVRVLIGTSLVGEGIDLPDASALVYAKGEKAEVALMQNAYRVCTATPGKSRALIVDFVDRHQKHLLGHSLERLKGYYNEPTFKVQVVEQVSDLLAKLREIDSGKGAT